MRDPLVRERCVRGPGYLVGEFYCHPDSELWQRENRIVLGPLLVFPGPAVEIVPAGHASLIADANHAVFYNPHQPYRRRLLDPRGDHCVFLGVLPETLAEIVAMYDPAARDRVHGPYRYSSGPITPRDYLERQRIHRAAFLDRADPLCLHESVLALFHSVVAASYRARGAGERPRRETARRHREAVQELQRLLATRYMEPLTLDDMAATVGLSAFHAARLFREHTGATLHHYRNQLRLTEGLQRLGEPACSLTDIALDLGYNSHSHFTAAFRRAFGVTPSRARHLVIVERESARALEHRTRPG
jgi:AraC family transcriptional regulator